jgi:hypothetical protein
VPQNAIKIPSAPQEACVVFGRPVIKPSLCHAREIVGLRDFVQTDLGEVLWNNLLVKAGKSWYERWLRSYCYVILPEGIADSLEIPSTAWRDRHEPDLP